MSSLIGCVPSSVADILGKWREPSPHGACFGAAEWKRFFDLDLGEVSLPEGIDELMAKQCPYFAGKTVGQSHDLIYIPGGLTLKKITDLLPSPLVIVDHSSIDLEAFSTGKPHFVLITREATKGLLRVPYSRPSLLDALISRIAIHLLTGACVHAGIECQNSHCSEAIPGRAINLMINCWDNQRIAITRSDEEMPIYSGENPCLAITR